MDIRLITPHMLIPYAGNIIWANPLRFVNSRGVRDPKAALVKIVIRNYDDFVFPGGVEAAFPAEQFAGIVCRFDLGHVAPLNRIMSCFVDNLWNEGFFYLGCPDTSFFELIQEHATRWFPLMTNDKQVIFYWEPRELGIDNDAQLTFYITNFPIIPSEQISGANIPP